MSARPAGATSAGPAGLSAGELDPSPSGRRPVGTGPPWPRPPGERPSTNTTDAARAGESSTTLATPPPASGRRPDGESPRRRATRPRSIPGWAHTGLGLRIFVGVLLVVAIEGATLGVVAYFAGPALFDRHLAMAGVTDSAVLDHAQQAYQQAIGIALGAGLIIALLGGAIAAWVIASRLARPLAAFSQVARRVSAGDYTTRVTPASLGPEFDRVEKTFNDMVRRLEATEETRAQLIADVSHEMRTPLMTLTAYLEALEDGVRPPLATTWEVMNDQVRRLSRLAGDMAVASADHEGTLALDLRRVDLVALARRTIASWREGPLGSLLTIDEHLPATPIVTTCDEARLGQVLTNLIDNACRHARGASALTVTLQGDETQVRLIVADDGDGIAPEHAERIFDRFYRADRSRTGTGAGLGLAISRAIMRAHGGSLVLDSTAPEGAVFIATLPLTPREPTR